MQDAVKPAPSGIAYQIEAIEWQAYNPDGDDFYLFDSPFACNITESVQFGSVMSGISSFSQCSPEAGRITEVEIVCLTPELQQIISEKGIIHVYYRVCGQPGEYDTVLSLGVPGAGTPGYSIKAGTTTFDSQKPPYIRRSHFSAEGNFYASISL